jgi:hypothetical protein
MIPIAGENINNGQYYPSNYDKPHDLSIVGNIRLSHRFSVSSNIVYSTGRPITLPFGMYYYAGAQRVLYSDRNAYRIPDNFRIDLSMNIEGNAKGASANAQLMDDRGVQFDGQKKSLLSLLYIRERCNKRIQAFHIWQHHSVCEF